MKARTTKEASVSWLLCSCAKENVALVGKVVIVGIIARMTEILSFLLPVKAFLISAGKKVPGFFPEILHQYDYHYVVLALAVLAILFYVISYVLRKHTEGKSGKLAISSLGLSLKKDNVSNKSVHKIAVRVFSSYVECFFILTVIFVMAVLSPFLLISLIPYYIYVAFAIKRNLQQENKKNIDCDQGVKGEESEYNFSMYVDIGFAIGLITALTISFYADNVEMIYLFVCFILMRRSSGSINKTIKNYVFLKTILIRSSCDV